MEQLLNQISKSIVENNFTHQELTLLAAKLVELSRRALVKRNLGKLNPNAFSKLFKGDWKGNPTICQFALLIDINRTWFAIIDPTLNNLPPDEKKIILNARNQKSLAKAAKGKSATKPPADSDAKCAGKPPAESLAENSANELASNPMAALTAMTIKGANKSYSNMTSDERESWDSIYDQMHC